MVGNLDFSKYSTVLLGVKYAWQPDWICYRLGASRWLIHEWLFRSFRSTWIAHQSRLELRWNTEKLLTFGHLQKKRKNYLLNLTDDLRYWNNMRNCTKMYRRKFESLNWSCNKFWLVKYLAKNCSSPALGFFFAFPEITSTLKLLKVFKTSVEYCKKGKEPSNFVLSFH